jgi:hypothetical protein
LQEFCQSAVNYPKRTTINKGRDAMTRINGRRNANLVLTGILLLVFLAGCGGGKSEPAKPNPSATAGQAQPAAVPSGKAPTLATNPGEWKPDGVIADNEYAKQQVLGELEVYSRVDGDKVRMALKAKTNGYVAIGFEPSERMKDADIILGFVKDGKASVADMFSTGPTGPHPPDDQQGGKNDVTVFGGSNKDGVTIIEFERKLDTGDSKDKVIKTGDNKIIWSISEEAAFSGKHQKRGGGILKL